MRSLTTSRKDLICHQWRLDYKSTTAVVFLVTVLFLSLATGAFYTLDQDSPALRLIYSTISTAQSTDLDLDAGPDNATTSFSSEPPCDRFPHPNNLVVSVKTGATEALTKLPTQLITNLRCVRGPLIFSDAEQRLGDYHIHDVLSHFSPAEMRNNPDFDIYRLQQDLIAEGREDELSSLRDIQMPQDDPRTVGHSAAWGLDKYKFLHMLERAWALAPNKDWYLFIEADTYLFWPNLLRWISTLDPSKKRYFGYPIRMWEHPTELYFAYGGAGFLLSGAAMREFAVKKRGLANRWDGRISEMWFGDYVLAAALEKELGLTITKTWPSTNPDEPEVVQFGAESWCEPVFTLHHVDALHSNELWDFERRRNFDQLLFRDLYDGIYPNGLPSERVDWDNLAGDDQVRLTSEPERLSSSSSNNIISLDESEEACADACDRNERCLQFLFVTVLGSEHGDEPLWQTECHLSDILRLGRERPLEVHDNGNLVTRKSVWMSNRITQWIQNHKECPTDTSSWPH